MPQDGRQDAQDGGAATGQQCVGDSNAACGPGRGRCRARPSLVHLISDAAAQSLHATLTYSVVSKRILRLPARSTLAGQMPWRWRYGCRIGWISSAE
jgi:hypothetical protein